MSVDFTQLAMSGVQGLQPYQPGKPVEELERELGITDSLKLASNENPLGPGQRALAALEGLNASLHLYPDGSGFRLKQALAERLGVVPEGITLGNGSNDVLDLVARVFLGPGRNAVFSAYAFAVYPISTRAASAEARVAPALPADHPVQPYGHDLEAMLARIDEDTRVVFVANPNNPTGTWLEAQALEAFLERVPPEVVVVIDEAYFEYVEAGDYPDAVRWLPRFPNLVVTRTFSKIHGLAGLRIGYALSSPRIADLLNRVRQPFNVNSLALAAAEAALDDEAHIERSRQVNRAGLRQLEAGLRALALDFIPSVGNFITVDVGRPAAPVYEALLREGVIVRPVANYGLPDHLRITVSTETDNRRVLEALERVLS